VLKSSRAINHVNVELKTRVSDISSVRGSVDIHLKIKAVESADIWNVGFQLFVHKADRPGRF
jgi:hypothetical protein